MTPRVITVVRQADGVKSWIVKEVQRVREGVWIWISSARYDGARILKVRIRIFRI